MTRLVLTGTTGHVGGGAARALVAAGHGVHQIVRDRSRALSGVPTSVVCGLDDREALVATLAPGDRGFMVSALRRLTGRDPVPSTTTSSPTRRNSPPRGALVRQVA